MVNYILMRLLRMIPQVLIISVLAFIIIQLPPGDFLTERLNRLRASGYTVDEAEVQRLTKMYGLDKPMHLQYLKWITNIVTKGDFGYSFVFSKPVNEIIGSRMGMTFFIAFLAFVVCWSFAIPVGILVAVKQYSVVDYFFTFLGFIGLAVPGFLLALVLMYVSYSWFGLKVGGLFSQEFQTAPWSWARFVDFLKHIWLPVIILAIGGTANLIRTLRATMLDELRKQYVTVARAKGLSEFKVLMLYPVRIAINPIVSTFGWLLVWFFSGGTVVEIVLNLDTAGPVLWRALMNQDMYTAGAYIVIIGTLTALGSLISDLMLAALDPRIRFGGLEVS
ncbi:MAG TPA: ABC transporter permease [Anaerolinea thermolimosa]|uniref:ABC transporter permease n=1 Tax=Anaerolinea thermolimosa TaxID=229919 RepID=A0A3D1JJC9_9CHLR|nr:ABC transporter permease [Anaerolinea thermolimosa]GAP07671.1 ABC-type dipeptide/oligopeptide/nickel transport systems, permease components [Anaerolinea thermolimosa]HCE18554.1 ABC transporter permease [Anaerolinea thermolimosa]